MTREQMIDEMVRKVIATYWHGFILWQARNEGTEAVERCFAGQLLDIRLQFKNLFASSQP